MMRRLYFFSAFFMLSFSLLAKKPVQKTTIEELIGKQQIHLQQITIKYLNLLDGKEQINAIDNELFLIEEHFRKLKTIVRSTSDKSLKKSYKKIKNSFYEFKSLVTEDQISSIGKIQERQSTLQVQLNQFQEDLNNAIVSDTENAATSLLKSNISITNQQVLNLIKYKLNQQLFEKTLDQTYLTHNKKLLYEVNNGISKLLKNNANKLPYNTKLSSLTRLVDYMKENELHLKAVIDDTYFIFEGLRDDYIYEHNKQRIKS